MTTNTNHFSITWFLTESTLGLPKASIFNWRTNKSALMLSKAFLNDLEYIKPSAMMLSHGPGSITHHMPMWSSWKTRHSIQQKPMCRRKVSDFDPKTSTASQGSWNWCVQCQELGSEATLSDYLWRTVSECHPGARTTLPVLCHVAAIGFQTPLPKSDTHSTRLMSDTIKM